MSGSLFKFVDVLRTQRFFSICTALLRIGLALTFVISGLRKLPGVLFTILPPDDPVGGFFHAMHETGFYWNFIGYYQIVVGIMLLIRRVAPLASLLMMPVTVNILLVSFALQMRGTPVITSVMFLGNLCLLFWYHEHFLPLLRAPRRMTEIANPPGNQ